MHGFNPPGAPPPGYGQPAPQGYGAPPPGYGQPAPQGMGGGFDPFSKAGHVSPSSNLPHLGVGDGRMIVENTKLVNGQNGMFYIAELYALGYSNPTSPAGSRVCFMPKVSGQYADSGLADAEAFAAACLGINPSDPRAKTLGGNTPEEARQVMLRSVSPEQPFRGCVVDVTVCAKAMRTKPGADPFMKHTWRPVLDAHGLPAKAAIPATAPSQGQPALQGRIADCRIHKIQVWSVFIWELWVDYTASKAKEEMEKGEKYFIMRDD